MIPESIKIHRPKGTEVRLFKGTYYVYKITSVWDKEKKKAKKKTLGCIGKILPDEGFIPSKKTVIPSIEKVVVKEYGCSQLFVQLNDELFDKLKEYFSSLYREIFTLAIIRLMNKTNNSTIKRYYDTSYLSEEFKELRLSENRITEFMRDLGERREQMRGFMQEFIPKGEVLLFDGTCIFSDSKESTYAKQGYNPRGKKNGQINLLYAFAKSDHMPVYYRLLPGNITDKAAFMNTVKESGIENCIIIGDNGFYSKSNTSFLDEQQLSYILPLRTDTKYVNDRFKALSDKEKFEDCFVYHDRVIWFTKVPIGDNRKQVYIFRDDGMKRYSELSFMRKKDAEYESYTLDRFYDKQNSYGMHYLYSNIETEPQDIYLSYKARWEIEECFDYLKNGLDLGTVYQRNNEKMESWAFLNHISLMLFYSLHRKLLETGLSKKYCVEEIIGLAKTISKVQINDDWYVSEMSKPDKDLFSAIGVNLYT